ncbi:MAG: prenyltransferase/squalene oxidase repeat-containing protein [Phycisphaerae bacterium]
MSIRREMRSAASAGANALPGGTAPLAAYLQSQLTDEGGFANKAGVSDLYYTVFGIQASLAVGLDLPVEQIVRYLQTFGDGTSLDLVHLSCLARCWADLPGVQLPDDRRGAIARTVRSYRSADGGYSLVAGAGEGSVYGCFVAAGAMQDIGEPAGDPARIGRFLAGLQTPEGGYVNEPALPFAATPSTAAALTLLANLGQPVPASGVDWLKRQRGKHGGWVAVPGAPVEDLLSTATALHALAVSGADMHGEQEQAGAFVRSLQTPAGGFCASHLDPSPDCEYTGYALVALGHTSR